VSCTPADAAACKEIGPAGGPNEHGTRRVKVEPFARRKQQRAPKASADLDRRGKIRGAAELSRPTFVACQIIGGKLADIFVSVITVRELSQEASRKTLPLVAHSDSAAKWISDIFSALSMSSRSNAQ